MEIVIRQLNLGLNAQDAFDSFVNNFNDWWPKEYTWSKDSLKEIKISPKIDGICTETGPYGFRYDWGRVTDFINGKTISFTWQIGPDRAPVPNPEKAGHVTIDFHMKGKKRTAIELRHVDFGKYGHQGSESCEMMGSDQGSRLFQELLFG